jgi:hypothetical protein
MHDFTSWPVLMVFEIEGTRHSPSCFLVTFSPLVLLLRIFFSVRRICLFVLNEAFCYLLHQTELCLWEEWEVYAFICFAPWRAVGEKGQDVYKIRFKKHEYIEILRMHRPTLVPVFVFSFVVLCISWRPSNSYTMDNYLHASVKTWFNMKTPFSCGFISVLPRCLWIQYWPFNKTNFFCVLTDYKHYVYVRLWRKAKL